MEPVEPAAMTGVFGGVSVSFLRQRAEISFAVFLQLRRVLRSSNFGHCTAMMFRNEIDFVPVGGEVSRCQIGRRDRSAPCVIASSRNCAEFARGIERVL